MTQTMSQLDDLQKQVAKNSKMQKDAQWQANAIKAKHDAEKEHYLNKIANLENQLKLQERLRKAAEIKLNQRQCEAEVI